MVSTHYFMSSCTWPTLLVQLDLIADVMFSFLVSLPHEISVEVRLDVKGRVCTLLENPHREGGAPPYNPVVGCKVYKLLITVTLHRHTCYGHRSQCKYGIFTTSISNLIKVK